MMDIVIRGGLVVDGCGAAPFRADVGIVDGLIAAVGSDLGPARREINAEDRIVTPGWVDIHSHYDGQVTWDPLVSPSGAHGVTTTVMGNCGVGFAPVRPHQRDWLINLMEGVEDIPGTALAEGIDWRWETFPEYLDALEAGFRVMDIATQAPHSAIRAYVMGERQAVRGACTPAELAQMETIVTEAIAAGALGLSTSRTKLHLAADGQPVPGSFVEIQELQALGRAMARGGGGIFQLVMDWSDPKADFAWLRALAQDCAVPISYALVQFDEAPGDYVELLALTAQAQAEGIDITAGVGARPVGMLINLESKVHPFSAHPSFRDLAPLPLAAIVGKMRDPELRARMMAETPEGMSRWWRTKMATFDAMFALGDPPDYEPAPEASVAATAARQGRAPLEVVYDLLLENEGRSWIYFPMINYGDRDFGPLHAMLTHPNAVLSLADGGAHCGMICDASAPTFLLSHWVRDRVRGPRLSLEQAVSMQTSRPAKAWGLRDRGVIAPGLRADLNVIDMESIGVLPPYWASDLPAQGRRLLQDARGYDFTLCAGAVTWEGGAHTGELPGRLVRGRR
ncbi:N-acyl-D-amino-acid deacylase family protein [Phenylobacterium sp.]|jgi:N-acyl-D-aspartate/D-glutamate deacylase|uniref:N-acyl-D-amino-acid deacylase family protein n=1 Tax=Phenylobacterium sp. TaxID=1871053 RepID=UPI002F400FEF